MRNMGSSNKALQIESSLFVQHRMMRDGSNLGKAPDKAMRDWIPGGHNVSRGSIEKHRCSSLSSSTKEPFIVQASLPQERCKQPLHLRRRRL